MALGASMCITYVPADCGSSIPGKSKAAKAFEDIGTAKKLGEAGLSVVSEVQALSEPATWCASTFPPGRIRNEDINVDVCHKVNASLAASLAVPPGSRPFQLILGGECCMLPAIMSAFWNDEPHRQVGLIYIDADTDLYSPTDSASTGVFAGMTMTHLLGAKGALDSMEKFSKPNGHAVCDATNTVFFGINMHAPGNKREHFGYLFDHDFKVVSSSSIARDPEQRAKDTLAHLEDKVDIIMVHLDVDSIDPRLFPLANVPNMTGVDFTAMMKALKVFLRHPKVGGLVVAEANPDHDPGLKMTERLIDEIVDGLKRR